MLVHCLPLFNRFNVNNELVIQKPNKHYLSERDSLVSVNLLFYFNLQSKSFLLFLYLNPALLQLPVHLDIYRVSLLLNKSSSAGETRTNGSESVDGLRETAKAEVIKVH